MSDLEELKQASSRALASVKKLKGELAECKDELKSARGIMQKNAELEAELLRCKEELGAALVRENNLIEASPEGRAAARKRKRDYEAPF